MLLSAGALLFDDTDRFMIVNPTHKAGWEIPGGIIEADESPRQACRRELIEEIGFAPAIGRLLSAVHALDRESGRQSIQFVFDGGAVGGRHIALNPGELSRTCTRRCDCSIAPLGGRGRSPRERGRAVERDVSGTGDGQPVDDARRGADRGRGADRTGAAAAGVRGHRLRLPDRARHARAGADAAGEPVRVRPRSGDQAGGDLARPGAATRRGAGRARGRGAAPARRSALADRQPPPRRARQPVRSRRRPRERARSVPPARDAARVALLPGWRARPCGTCEARGRAVSARAKGASSTSPPSSPGTVARSCTPTARPRGHPVVDPEPRARAGPGHPGQRGRPRSRIHRHDGSRAHRCGDDGPGLGEPAAAIRPTSPPWWSSWRATARASSPDSASVSMAAAR